MYGGSLDQADIANAALRTYVREHGDRPWAAEELAELAQLRARWTAATGGARLRIRQMPGPVSGAAVVTAA